MTWFIMNVMLQDNKRSACITTSCRFLERGGVATLEWIVAMGNNNYLLLLQLDVTIHQFFAYSDADRDWNHWNDRP